MGTMTSTSLTFLTPLRVTSIFLVIWIIEGVRVGDIVFGCVTSFLALTLFERLKS